MRDKKILFVVAECHGFAETGGLAEVAGSLPQALMASSRNYKVSVMMPLYRSILRKYQGKLKFLGERPVVLAWRKQYCGLYYLKQDKIDYYFISNNYYFDREEIYGHYDDGERFAFFSKSVFETIPLLNFIPDIIHTHDWHTALVNIYLDVLYKKAGYFTQIKSIFTIHNIQYQGIFELNFLDDVIGIGREYQDILEYNGLINLVKGAIVCSDLVTTVSPRYAREITTAQYACGLENITRMSNQKIDGILNGINTTFYNPATDEVLEANYDADTFALKAKNKEALQRGLNLEVDSSVCVVSMISRLVNIKGLDLIVDAFPEMMKEKIQFVLLGKGDSYYEEKFKEFQKKYPRQVRSLIAFDINLSKKIYAGSDLFLMPSKTEPCGLSQMIACRYGTVPLVRATGGLDDSIKDYQGGNGNGFVFKEYTTTAFLAKFREALDLYNQDLFSELANKIMRIDFSWNASAQSYIETYKKLLKKN
ncbi:MAG: glycogen synthase [Acholeplasmataceae bacterium]|nr:glycogen synthase [Acholeplasmataceae bacterium]